MVKEKEKDNLKDCEIEDCPQNKVGLCELSILKNEYKVDPATCSHRLFRIRGRNA